MDFLRGLAIAGMLVVNNPATGSMSLTSCAMRSGMVAPWPTAFFPFFCSWWGCAWPWPWTGTRFGPARPGFFWAKVLRRTAVLFLLGVLENVYLHLQLEHLRIPGVLQRIAVVYLATVWLHVRLGNRGVVAMIVTVLVGYWLLLVLVPVPGLGRPSLASDVNLEGWVDQLLLRGHIWSRGTTWDPEGVLSTLPAVALGAIGLRAGRWLRAGGRRTFLAFVLGLILVGCGLGWGLSFPLNKSLFTSSFVLTMGGLALVLLAAGHGTLDGRALAVWAKPLVILGTNPLTLYVVASFAASTLRHIKLAGGPGGTINLQVLLYRTLFGAGPRTPGRPWPGPSFFSWRFSRWLGCSTPGISPSWSKRPFAGSGHRLDGRVRFRAAYFSRAKGQALTPPSKTVTLV